MCGQEHIPAAIKADSLATPVSVDDASIPSPSVDALVINAASSGAGTPARRSPSAAQSIPQPSPARRLLTTLAAWYRLAVLCSRVQGRHRVVGQEPDAGRAVRIAEYELTTALLTARAAVGRPQAAFGAVRVLVRCHGIPVGQLEMPDSGDANAVEIPLLVKKQRLDQHECFHTWPVSVHERRSPASVVIPTRDRPASLGRLITSLRAVAATDIEFLIVDNAPATAATRDLVEAVGRSDGRFRYLCEPRRGAARARNTGLAAAGGRAIAFLDDDTQVDQHWLPAILSGFDAADNVGCVTGLVLPDELTTSAQIWFEQYGGFGKGFERRVYDRWTRGSALYPYAAGAFGSGNNVAFDADTVRELGGFNEILGPGTPTHAGEDLELFTRTIRSGHRIVYEPSAIVYHTHRQQYGELLDQLRNYGTGLSAMLLAQATASPRELLEIMRRVPAGLLFLLLPRSSKNVSRGPRFPAELVLTEVLGIASGPFAYARARRAQLGHGDRSRPGEAEDHAR